MSRRRTGERRRSLAVSSRSVVISGRACVRSVRDRGRCETPVLSQIPSASRAFRALALGQPDPPGRGGIWAWARIFTHRTRDRTSLSPWARAHPWLLGFCKPAQAPAGARARPRLGPPAGGRARSQPRPPAGGWARSNVNGNGKRKRETGNGAIKQKAGQAPPARLDQGCAGRLCPLQHLACRPAGGPLS